MAGDMPANLGNKFATRTFELKTPLDAGVILFHHMTVKEELGQLSEFQLDALSEKGDIDLDQILGKRVSVKVELPNQNVRYFTAFVARFGAVGMEGRYHHYRA